MKRNFININSNTHHPHLVSLKAVVRNYGSLRSFTTCWVLISAWREAAGWSIDPGALQVILVSVSRADTMRIITPLPLFITTPALRGEGAQGDERCAIIRTADDSVVTGLWMVIISSLQQ